MAVTNSGEKAFESVYCASGFTHGRPYILDFDASAHGPVAAAPATLALGARVGVPQGATTTAPGWYPFQTKGYCEAMCDGTGDSADGGFLEVINAGTAFVVDHDTVRTAGSAAVNCYGAAITAATPALYPVYLIGDPVTVAGS